MLTNVRSGRILIQMAVIIGIGFALGVVDMTLRPIDLKPRPKPPPIQIEPAHTGVKLAPQAGSEVEVTPAKPAPPAAATPTTPAAAGGETPFQQTPKSALPEGQITVDEAKVLYDRGLSDGNTYFVDARKVEDYVKGHVSNAIRIDTAMFQLKEPAELGLIPRTGNVVVYCNGGHCDESENVAKRLNGSGYPNVYVMHDGYPGWKALGHPVEVGE